VAESNSQIFPVTMLVSPLGEFAEKAIYFAV